jgi:hypothetical protein
VAVPTPPALAFLARLRVTVAPAVALGPVDGGQRVMIPITGGTVEGPRLSGVVMPGGADWATRRGDGTSRVWARYALRLDDGTVLGVTNAGIVGAAIEGRREGRTRCEIEAPDGPHGWLRDAMILGVLTLGPEAPDCVVLEFWQAV